MFLISLIINFLFLLVLAISLVANYELLSEAQATQQYIQDTVTFENNIIAINLPEEAYAISEQDTLETFYDSGTFYIKLIKNP